MARRDTGRATFATLTAFSTPAAAIGALLALLVCQGARAATLTDVRVGKHQEFTRVVLELDSLAGYQVFEPEGAGDATIELHLDASAAPRRVTAQEGLVRQVEVEPAGSKTVVRVALERPELLINEMILLAPPRIVFDLRDPAAAAASSAAAPSQVAKAEPPKASPKPKPTPEPQRAASAATSAEAESPAGKTPERKPIRVVAAPQDVTPPSSSGKRAANPAATPAGVAAQNPAAAEAYPNRVPGAAGAAPMDSSGSSDLALEMGSPAESEEPDATPTGLDSASQRDAAGPMAGADMRAVSPAGSEPPPLPIPDSVRPGQPNPAASARAAVRPSPADATSEGGMLSLLTGNLLYVGAGALALVLLLVVVIRRRGEGEDALSPVMAADDLGGGDVLFDDPESVTEPVPAAPSGRVAASSRNGAAAAASDAGRGIEDRVASLETTLQQLIQAREQIERQLAAQTEELRVQRAAIARTQRAVRSGGNGEEESGATEPVPRAPAN